jgi:D-glycero-D-manno-heptose 1,7-bisphosphate phosphatase
MRERLAEQGITLAGVYHCPHHPQGRVAAYATPCDCRKPAPGMLLRAAAELDLDVSRSVMVGDKASDARAGRAAGVRWTVLVESGHPLIGDTAAVADHRCADLLQASDWVCRQLTIQEGTR